MQTVYLKENEGIAGHNFVGQLSSSGNSAAPWWSAFGSSSSQSLYGGDSCGQIKSFSLEQPTFVDQLAPTKQSARGQHTTQFTIFPGI